MKSVLILHAWQDGTSAHWYPWLADELAARGYTVTIPELPTMRTVTPDLIKMIPFLEHTVPLTPDLTVIGHSLGSVLALRLAELYPVKTLLLVAGWDFDDLYPPHRLFWPDKIHHDAIMEHAGKIVCFSSDNDPYITAFEVEEMSKRLHAEFVLVPGAGHFTKDSGKTELPELLPYL